MEQANKNEPTLIADIKISLYEKDVCDYCRGDIAAAAKVLGLNQ